MATVTSLPTTLNEERTAIFTHMAEKANNSLDEKTGELDWMEESKY